MNLSIVELYDAYGRDDLCVHMGIFNSKITFYKNTKKESRVHYLSYVYPLGYDERPRGWPKRRVLQYCRHDLQSDIVKTVDCRRHRRGFDAPLLVSPWPYRPKAVLRNHLAKNLLKKGENYHITLQLSLRVESSFWRVLTSHIVFTGRKFFMNFTLSQKRVM